MLAFSSTSNTNEAKLVIVFSTLGKFSEPQNFSHTTIVVYGILKKPAIVHKGIAS